MGKGTFKFFVLFNVYVTTQTAIGLLVIIKTKIFEEKSKNMEHFSLNPIGTIFYYNTLPFREMLSLYLVPSVLTRSSLYLPEIDPVTKEAIVPFGHDPNGHRDDLLYIAAIFFTFFSGTMLVQFVNGVRNNNLYIDRIKNKKSKNSKMTVQETFEFIFNEKRPSFSTFLPYESKKVSMDYVAKKME